MYTGGGPVLPGLMDDITRLAPRADIVALYGSTEAEPIAVIDRKDLGEQDRAATLAGGGLLAGPPVDGIELAILPDHDGAPIGPFTRDGFEAIMLGPGEAGEIVVSGSNVVSGYIDPTHDTLTKFRVGATIWHRTGDGGYFDDRGRLWLVGRCLARLELPTGRLYPLAVEAPARSLAGVANAAMLQIGKTAVLALEQSPAGPRIDPDDARARLAWAHGDRVVIVPQIPMDRRHQSKIDYAALKARVTI